MIFVTLIAIHTPVELKPQRIPSKMARLFNKYFLLFTYAVLAIKSHL